MAMTMQMERMPQERRGVRRVLVLTGVTLTLVGSVMVWQLRSTGIVSLPVTNRSHASASTGPLLPGVAAERAPASDQEMYQAWPQRTAFAGQPVDPGMVSDAEMFSRVQVQDTVAPAAIRVICDAGDQPATCAVSEPARP
jgi:hypothetical protein